MVGSKSTQTTFRTWVVIVNTQETDPGRECAYEGDLAVCQRMEVRVW